MFVGEHSSAFARSTADIFLLDSIKEFVAYAKRQGSQHADRYYYHLTSLANKAAGITEGRDKAGIQQLNSLTLIEHIIKEVIRQGMAEGKYYKDIYVDGKERIRQFKEISFLTSKGNT